MDQLSADLQSLRIAREAPAQPKRGKALLFAGLAVVLVGVGVRFVAVPALSGAVFKQSVSLTEVGLVSPSQASVDLTASGYVIPQHIAKLGAKVPGRVKEVRVKEWDHVNAGDPIMVLDSADEQSALHAAEARSFAAHARVAVARADLAQLRLELERNKKLAASGSVPSSTVEDMTIKARGLEEQVRAAQADAHAQSAEAEAMGVRLHDMTIVAPFSGVIMTKPSAIGEVVGPDQVVATIEDDQSLLVEVDVTEARIGNVKAGSPCEVQLDAFPGKRFRGEVVEMGPVLDRSKGSVTTKVKFVDVVEGVRGQMAARVSFLSKPLDEATLKEPPKKVIPAAAVADRAGSKVAFVMDGGRVHMVPLTLGDPMAGGFEVKAGIEPGTKVVRNPPADLHDGQSVKEETEK